MASQFYFNNWGNCSGVDCCDDPHGCSSCCFRQRVPGSCVETTNHSVVVYRTVSRHDIAGNHLACILLKTAAISWRTGGLVHLGVSGRGDSGAAPRDRVPAARGVERAHAEVRDVVYVNRTPTARRPLLASSSTDTLSVVGQQTTCTIQRQKACTTRNCPSSATPWLPPRALQVLSRSSTTT